MIAELPTADEVAALSESMTGTVTAEILDGNDHMDIVQYLTWGSRGADALVRAVGIDDAYRSERQMGVFTAQHHLAYYRELRAGDRFAVAGRILDRSAKAVHMMTFLVDTGRGRIANTLEILLIHVDLRHRRSVELPADIAGALDEHIARSRSLPWSAPVCGAIGIRRREVTPDPVCPLTGKGAPDRPVNGKAEVAANPADLASPV